MNRILLYCAGHTAALHYTVNLLKQRGYIFLDKPCYDATHLLLPVPSFTPEGTIKGGGELQAILSKLPPDITVIGGNLDCDMLQPYKKIDLLQDPLYIAHNANITAHCAVKLAMNKLPVTLTDCPVLVIGWGRIGKCLAKLLRQLGANVTVAARKPADRAILSALGYAVTDTTDLPTEQFRLIYNTAPIMLCPQCSGNALKIDLASKPGLGGLDIVWARGLPAKDAPESSGELIANTVIRRIGEKEL